MEKSGDIFISRHLHSFLDLMIDYMYKYLICVFIFFLGNAKMYAQRVACIGASITYGATIPEREKYAYPAQLGALLGVGYEVFNYGVSGCTMLKKGNLSYWNTKEYLQALSCSPDVVFIDLGGNDSKLINRKYLNEFEADCRAMIRSFRNLPSNPRVILLTPIVSFVTDTTGIWNTVIARDIVPMTKKVASKEGVEIIDMHPLLEDRPDLLKDKIHPNAEGAKMMANKMYDLLMQEKEK